MKTAKYWISLALALTLALGLGAPALAENLQQDLDLDLGGGLSLEEQLDLLRGWWALFPDSGQNFSINFFEFYSGYLGVDLSSFASLDEETGDLVLTPGEGNTLYIHFEDADHMTISGGGQSSAGVRDSAHE